MSSFSFCEPKLWSSPIADVGEGHKYIRNYPSHPQKSLAENINFLFFLGIDYGYKNGELNPRRSNSTSDEWLHVVSAQSPSVFPNLHNRDNI